MTVVKKNAQGYGYRYTDLAEIHNYLEENGRKYIQKIERIDGDDYIFTKRYVDGKWEDEWLQGCRVVQATLSGKSNPAQEQGSALTYCRRYSVLMAFGLACSDDDAQCLTKPQKKTAREMVISTAKALGISMEELSKDYNLDKNTSEERFQEVLMDLAKGEQDE